MRRVLVLSFLVLAACGGAEDKEPETPRISADTVPSLALLGRGRGDRVGQVSAYGSGSSCREAVDVSRRAAEAGDIPEEPPPEHDDEVKEILNNGTYLNSCEVAEDSAIDICAVVKDGGVTGVTVELSAGTEKQANCIADAVRRLAFPEHEAASVPRTHFAPH